MLHWLRYGDEIARLQLAETLAKKALDAVKPGLSTAVSSDLRVRAAFQTSNFQVY